MTQIEFAEVVARHRADLVRFARWLGAAEPEDVVHSTVERLTHAGAYLKYDFEPEATKIPAWFRRALRFTVQDSRSKWKRRQRLLAANLEERIGAGELVEAKVKAGPEDPDGGDPDPERELGAWPVDFLVQAEDAAHHKALLRALDVVLATAEPEVAKAMMLVFAEGRTWKEAEEVTGVPANALRMRVARAVPRIKEQVLAATVRSGDLALSVNAGSRRSKRLTFER